MNVSLRPRTWEPRDWGGKLCFKSWNPRTNKPGMLMSKRADKRLILALEEETNSLLYLFSLTWSMEKDWLTLRQVYNHLGRREDIPHGKPWPPSFVYQTIETKDAREKIPRSLMLGEEKEVLASVIEELEEEISQSSTNYSTDQSQDNGRSRVSRTACPGLFSYTCFMPPI